MCGNRRAGSERQTLRIHVMDRVRATRRSGGEKVEGKRACACAFVCCVVQFNRCIQAFRTEEGCAGPEGVRLGTLDVGACGCMSAEGMGMKANNATTLERAELLTNAGRRDEVRALRPSVVETW